MLQLANGFTVYLVRFLLLRFRVDLCQNRHMRHAAVDGCSSKDLSQVLHVSYTALGITFSRLLAFVELDFPLVTLAGATFFFWISCSSLLDLLPFVLSGSWHARTEYHRVAFTSFSWPTESYRTHYMYYFFS